MNPDGYDARPHRKRNNDRGIDLNRAFPKLGPTAPQNGAANNVKSQDLEPEVKASAAVAKMLPLRPHLSQGLGLKLYIYRSDACLDASIDLFDEGVDLSCG
jgi:hypothetical protein